MGTRMELHTMLKNVIGNDNVYFQPPPTVKMVYPCIVYKRDDIKTSFADGRPYKKNTRYQVTVIDSNPDSELPQKVAMLPMCTYERFYTADNLNHDLFKIFF